MSFGTAICAVTGIPGAARAGIGAALCIVLLAGCAGAPAPRPDAADPLRAVEALERQALPSAATVTDVDVLAVSPAMERFLERYLREYPDSRHRVDMLRYVIIHPGLLGFTYDQSRTRTAAAAFEARNGNCLTLSNLFIALARRLGIDAHYQEVSLGNSWTKHEDLYLLNRHINVRGRLRNGQGYVMDFIHIDTELAPNARTVTDARARARAQYYNNLGVEHLYARETAQAVAWFKKAIATAPELDYVWSNLATAYGRVSEYAAAEAAFHTALALNAENWSAINNLAILYRRTGREAEAERALGSIERFRLRNPYYRIELSEQAYQNGDYREAIA
ncbi:MAG: tetratricopeptide repeat protein [Gammaproteobacteria bacterium]|nr:tetratricopeptide repeat protein [Gammaproteobacteria bacterium]